MIHQKDPPRQPVGLFVTGTDTGVGKTTIATGLLAAARARGHAVAALKPAETGCASDATGALLPDDGLLLRAAAGLADVPIETIVPHRYALPAAPAVAARREGHPFTLPEVMAARAQLLERAPQLLLIEGAGGLLVPYADGLLGVQLARAFGHPLLIVGRAGLGTINHTLLTIFEARRHELPIAGVILNQTAAEAGAADELNAGEIERLGRVRVLAVVPHLAPTVRRDPAALAGLPVMSNILNLLI